MFKFTKRLVLTLTFCSLFLLASQEASAIRFGLQSGLYNEGFKTNCGSSRDVGLRLGFYLDKTPTDVMYAAAVRGINLCGPNGCFPQQQVMSAPVSCSSSQALPMMAPIPVSCSSSMAMPQTVSYASPQMMMQAPMIQQPEMVQQMPMQQMQPERSNNTEIYLLVLPESQREMAPAPRYSYAPPVAYERAPERSMREPESLSYYREPIDYRQPVRGMW
ncbi:MAG TPA: hypothetical protein V6C96_02365 [Vampirovibrionales bacterium]